ncbi:hypothetical protein LOAG_13637 [Loa loa]|uniref:BPTI/Kunitz inhibitor domain-containing protein n=1 Tax=Loa loa TaxID=7209 RepID=A0A1S0TKI1_LOALO|nr:hypothetical protein LOAG_13637 [Loa loa]EFO14878.2 hypothetical protein LOAG_13637 [Loa loa]
MVVMLIMMMMMVIGSMHYYIAINALPFPDDLDSFLEMLFEHTECEDFLSDDKWSTVGLRDCKPYVCKFPYELCKRPAAKYQDETSNTCSKIPEDCLIAVNGGIALTTDANTFTDNGITNTNLNTDESELTAITSSLSSYSNGFSTTLPSSIPITELATKSIDSLMDICNLDQPQGRFCGFTIKVAYNRNNQRCEQFWFPGCRTIETNQNLFDTVDECLEKTIHCRGTGSFVPFFTTRYPAISTSAETPSPPVPLVAPFLATTIAPRAIVPVIIDAVTPAKPRVAPIARPPRLLPWFRGISGEVVNPRVRVIDPQPSLKPAHLTVQPYWLTNPSGANMILGLISNSISQFTGGGSEETGGDGNFFRQIPQFLRLLQGG